MTDYQKGERVGKIVFKKSPTLIIDFIKSNNVLFIPKYQDEYTRVERTLKHHIDNCEYSKYFNLRYLPLRKKIQKFYLPETFRYKTFSKIKNINEFKEGLSVALFDSDGCHYNHIKEKIKINTSLNYSIITLILSD
jgi:hypothetical protein